MASLEKADVMMWLAIAGLNRNDAARHAGVSKRTFLRMMKRHRVQAPRSHVKLSAAKVSRIRSLLEKHTQGAVAEMMQVHPLTIGMVGRYETWRWVR